MTATIQTPDTWKDQINWDDLKPPCERKGHKARYSPLCPGYPAEYLVVWICPNSCTDRLRPHCKDCAEIVGRCRFCQEAGQYKIVEKL